MQSTLTAAEVNRQASERLIHYLQIADAGRACPATVLVGVVLAACARLTSVFAAGLRLAAAPAAETIRQALRAALPEPTELERRLNRALAADLPRRRPRQRDRVAIDLTLIPYHGRPESDPREVYRGQPKHGTTHFHAYATACLLRRGRRSTVALTYVYRGERMEAVLGRLLRRCTAVGLRIQLLLLDRGFWSVGVIRFLQAGRRPFVIPMIARGRRPGRSGGPSGSWVFQTYDRSGWSRYTLRETGGGRAATVAVAVHVRYRRGRRGRHGRERLAYAYGGWQPRTPAAVSAVYRRRFGIETSYRQMNQARPRTCSRSPAVRLFLVGVALVLRNVWVWLHAAVVADRPRGRPRVRLARLRFKALLLMLLHAVEAALGTWDDVPIPTPGPASHPTPMNPPPDIGNY